MNPKKQVVIQAIADLLEVRQTIDEISREYLKYAPSILNIFDTDFESDPEMVYQLDDAIEKTLRERRNIANNLFHDYNASEPNDKYYNPNPTPVFSTKDFKIPSDFKPAWNIKAHNSPMIVTHGLNNDIAGKPYASEADRAIENIDIFIDQLKRKLNQRKDLQEEKNIMKINKSYIKQIIKEELEAVINEGSYEDMISDMEKDMEDHMARKSMDKMSDPSPAPARPRTKPNMSSEEIEDTMTSLAKQLQAQGFGVSLKINGEKKV